MKRDVAIEISDYIKRGGFLFSMCSATNSIDIALALWKDDNIPIILDGDGFFTFLAGHDPEDYVNYVNDPPTDLPLFKHSPVYRLILNNILFPASKQKKKKT